jgi:hypothetical protein
LVAAEGSVVVSKDISFEESHHHRLPGGKLHRRLYPRPGEFASEKW